MADVPLCLGCGEQITKATDRHNLCNTSSRHVFNMWREFFKRKLERRNQLSVLMDSGEIIAANGVYQKNMCKKCFYYFEKFLRAEEVATL